MYLAGRKFKIVTDSVAARTILDSNYDKGGGRLTRWRLSLADFDYDIVHRAGERHMDADLFSRNPLPSTSPYGEDPTVVDPLDVLSLQPADAATGRRGTSTWEPRFSTKPRATTNMWDVYTDSGGAKRRKTPGSGVEHDPVYVPPDKRIDTLMQLAKRHAGMSRSAFTRAAKNVYYWPSITWDARSIVSAGAVPHDTVAAAYFEPEDHIFCGPKEMAKHQRESKASRWLTSDGKVADGYHEDKDGVIYTGDKDTKHPRIVVPTCLRAHILRTYHTTPAAGHLGAAKTYPIIKRKYWWRGMREDVKRWIKACKACCARKTPRPTRAGDPAIICNATAPWHTLAVDLMDAAAMKTSEGYSYILTATCLFTRWTIAVPLKDKRAQSVAEALMNHVFCKFGKPRAIRSDDGKEFVNAGIKYLYKHWNIAPISTGGYQSQANPVERRHRNINEAMTILSTQFGKDWDTYLQAVVFNYNISNCDATGYSPYELLFGKQARPLHEDNTNDRQEPANTSTFQGQMVERMQEAYEFVKKQQTKVAKRNQARRAKLGYVKDQVFKPADSEAGTHGDFVMYWEPQQSITISDAKDKQVKSSWKPKWTGPHRVTRRWKTDGGYRYEIWHVDRATKIATHPNKLSKFDAWSQELPSTSAGMDAKRIYELGGCIEEDSFIIVPLQKPYYYGVAKTIEVTSLGEIRYRWWGNSRNDNLKTLKPGWLTAATDKPYYADKARSKKDAPYEGHKEIPIRQKDVTLHSFKLTDGGRLPARIIRALNEDARIGGE